MKFLRDIQTRFGVVGELLAFFFQHKWWWLTPMLVILLAFGLMIVFAQSSAVAPFIYTLF